MIKKSLKYCFLLLIHIVFGQTESTLRQCATNNADRLKKSTIPNYKNIIESELEFQNHLKKFKNSRFSNDTIIIPVIVHIVHNGDAVGTNENISKEQVYSQLEVINEDFQKKEGSLGYNSNPVGTGMPIKFMPAYVDENDSLLPEPGIHRVNGSRATWDNISDIDNILKPSTQYDPTKYLNVWVVTFGGSMTSQLGYAQFPDLSSLSGIDMYNGIEKSDGIVIRHNVFGRIGNLKSPYNKGRTLTHEMGHFLGLLHIWGNYDDNLSCTEDDGCDDTPKTKRPIYTCTSNVISCESGVNAMKENYLDYTNDACMNTFTIDQSARIMTVLNNCPRRKELTSSKVYINPNTTTGINSQLSKTTISIYPNPSEDYLTISSSQEIKNLTLINTLGNEVNMVQIKFISPTLTQLMTQDLPQGTYFVKVQLNQGWVIEKIFKK